MLKKKNLVGVVGGLLTVLGFFLPFTEEVSFFRSFSAPYYGFFGPALVLTAALTAVLYALGLKTLPFVLGTALLLLCAAFPVYAMWRHGLLPVLKQLRFGAALLFLGLALLPLRPLLP